jgi:hypothetical protein
MGPLKRRPPQTNSESATRKKLNGMLAASPRETYDGAQLKCRATERRERGEASLHSGDGGVDDAKSAEQVENAANTERLGGSAAVDGGSARHA